MEGENRVGDTGTPITLTIMDEDGIVDISGATTKNILIKRQDKTLLTKAGSFTTDGTDGKLTYSTIASDFNTKGTYCVQAKVILPAGTWHSDIDDFEVFANLT